MDTIFLSYAWGPTDASGSRPLQARAHGVASALRRAGYAVWVDTERMSGAATGGAGLSDAMATGISSAAAVVVCFSEAYARSANCKRELGFAEELGKRIFYVNVGEPGYTAKAYLSAPDPDHSLGWLVFRMQDALWADFRTPDAGGLALLLSSLEAAGCRRGGGGGTIDSGAPSPASVSDSAGAAAPGPAPAAPTTPALPQLTQSSASAYELLATASYEQLPTPLSPTAAAAPPAPLSADAFVVPSLDRAGAEALLAPHAARGVAGAFIIRGSREGPGNYAISMTAQDPAAAAGVLPLRIRHSLAQAVSGRPGVLRVAQDQAGGGGPREFGSLAEVVRAFSSLEHAVLRESGKLVPRADALAALDADTRYASGGAAAFGYDALA